MNLQNKHVWDLTLDEIEHVYSNLHMNNYVYAALMTYYNSAIPLNRKVSLKKDNVPECLIEGAQRLIEISSEIGRSDANLVRTAYTFYAHQFFKSLRGVSKGQMEQTIDLLSALAYISIVADKNDGLLIWWPPVVRHKNKYITDRFDNIHENMDLDEFLKIPISSNEIINNRGISNKNLLIKFMHRAVESVIAMTENGVEKEKIAESYQNIERCMLKFERKNDMVESSGDLREKNQMRYRNTLYLYGGNNFERMGNLPKAFLWYTKNIYSFEILDMFGYCLTDLKTCERLLCAFRAGAPENEVPFLKNLIDHALLRAFHVTAEYAEEILDAIMSTPDVNISAKTFVIDNRPRNYAGEASREIFLIAILYNKIIRNIDYSNIDYKRFLISCRF